VIINWANNNVKGKDIRIETRPGKIIREDGYTGVDVKKRNGIKKR